MIVYWPSMSSWEECPRQYLWRRGFPGIDVGGGEGRQKPFPEGKTDEHALVGTVVQKAVEVFYNMRGWERDEDDARQILRMVANDEFDKEVRKASEPPKQGRKPNFRLAPRADLAALRADVIRSAQGFVATCHANKLYGDVALPEHKLAGRLRVDPEVVVSGRLDLYLVQSTETGPFVLDGKNGREYWDDDARAFRMHVDVDQLVFYALAVSLVYGQVPKRLGVVPYRYPAGYDWEAEVGFLRDVVRAPDATDSRKRALAAYEARGPSKGIVWYDCDQERVEQIAARAIRFADEMLRIERKSPLPMPPDTQAAVVADDFPARVGGQCRICDYESICEPRQVQLAELRAKRKPVVTAPFVAEENLAQESDLDGLAGLASLVNRASG